MSQRRHPFPSGGRSVAVLATFLFLTLVTTGAGTAQAAWSHGNWTEVFTSTTTIHDFAVSSDGGEGTLVMYQNRELMPTRSLISRLSRTGSELWGDEGSLIPFNINSTNQVYPIAIAPDGNGGAYCVWSEWHDLEAYFRLGRFDASGTMLWAKDFGYVGQNPGTAGVQLVYEPGIGVTVGYAASIYTLTATRYDPDGNLLWSASVTEHYVHNIRVSTAAGSTTDFDMQRDGQGGVLFAWYRYDPDAYEQDGVYFEQIGVQKIDSAGNVLWGSDGHLVWEEPGFPALHFYHVHIVADAAGGAYVVTSADAKTYGQHLDAAGNETWAAGGVVLQETSGAGWDIDTYPRICRDGAGGLYLIQNYGDIYAQRIDINGSSQWGSNGIIAAATSSPTESFSSGCIAEDGFGGAVVGWLRWDDGARSLGGLRFDGFGTVLWNDKQLFDAAGNDEIQELHVVSDMRGGAHYVWKRHVSDEPEKDDIYALGVNPQGQLPEPVLYGFSPDAAEPGQVLPVWLFGEYLDETYDYNLRKGNKTVHMTGIGVVSSDLIGGWYDFAHSPIGAYDLYATLDGNDHSTLPNAFGVGMPPSCDSEELIASYVTAENSGTRRKMDFDSNGDCRFGVLNYDLQADESVIYVGSNDLNSPTTFTYLCGIPGNTVNDLAFTVDPNDHNLIAYVDHVNDIDYLVYDAYYEDGTEISSARVEHSLTPDVQNPVMVVATDGKVHLVCEQGTPGSMGLDHLVIDEYGSDLSFPLTATNAHAPDLAVLPDGLAMVYLTNSWIPGVTDLNLQYYRNGAWESTQVVTFAFELKSPTVSCDSDGGLLLAWILDNSGNGSAPILQTCLVTNGTLGPIRSRATEGSILRVQADAQGPGNFYLLTQETSQPMQFFLRGGNGEVFYPKLRLNADDDSDWPLFAAQHGGARIAAMWQSYNVPDAGNALMGWFCSEGVTTGAPELTPSLLSVSVKAYPNPFNPRTTVAFSLSQDQWVQLDVIDLHGRRVRSLLNGPLTEGDQEVQFDGRDDQGVPLASGTYFARLRPAHDTPATAKLTLLK